MPEPREPDVEFLDQLNISVHGLQLSGRDISQYLQHMGYGSRAPEDALLSLHLVFKHGFGLTFLRATPMEIEPPLIFDDASCSFLIQVSGSSYRRDLETGEEFRLEAGEAAIFPNTRGYLFHNEVECEQVTIWFAYAALGIPERKTPLVFRSDTERSAIRVLGDLAVSFLAHTPSPTLHDIGHFRLSAEHLARSAYEVHHLNAPGIAHSGEASLCERGLRLIELRAVDTSLTVPTIAAELSVSETTLRRAFHEEGRRPHAEITAARLRVHDRLVAGYGESITQAEAARRSGFGSAKSLQRALKQRTTSR